MELPLFPLNTVLFPGASLPLHIFEERYKQMIAECLEAQRPFGIALIRRGMEVGEPAEPFEIGTTAYITNVEQLPEGRMNVLCAGRDRFRLKDIVSERPYLLGDVEIVDAVCEDDPETMQLAGRAAGLFAQYLHLYLAMTNQWARTVEVPSPPGPLADYIGARIAVDAFTKQRLLEELSARKRLSAEESILANVVTEMAPRMAAVRQARWAGFSILN